MNLRCSNCYTENRAEARFCKRCGFWLLSQCPFCNATLPDAALFCDHCGRQLNPQFGITPQSFERRRGADVLPSPTAPASGVGPNEPKRLTPTRTESTTQSAAPKSELHQYIPQELMKKLETARNTGVMVGERRVVTMLFCDLKGSTAAAEGLDPEDWTEIMNGAECKISKASLLIEACNLIDQMKISEQNQDVQGDLYEYMLSHLQFAGRNGQFRTPRHVIRMMVQMIDPKRRERIGDLAAGTGGFLVNAHQYLLEKHTSAGILEYDAEGLPHHLIGDLLKDEDRKFMKSKKYLRGFDNDSGMTILRIGSMNLMLHGIEAPQFFYRDTLSKSFDDERDYDVILMNPPFKGAVDKGDVHPGLPSDTTKSELLFLHRILRALEMGGRAAVIVPDGVLFGSSRAHVEIRRKIIEENRLDGVVSMPSGVFKPYAGVSTAVLFITRGAKTEDIWFYDMAHDGFSLDDKRVRVAENDIPDILVCWRNRFDKKFVESREQRIAELKQALAPLKWERLGLHEKIDEMTFVKTLTENRPDPHRLMGTPNLREREPFDPAKLEKAQKRLAELEAQIKPLQRELEQLSRQFWVTKEQVKANKYDLSASRYRQVEADDVYHPRSHEIIDRLLELNEVMNYDLLTLQEVIDADYYGFRDGPIEELDSESDNE